MSEGSESLAFWESLGGKEEYANTDYLKDKRPARLFQCSEASGIVEVT